MNNILLICPDAPEKLIALTPALSILKRNFPRAQISVISPQPWFFKNNSAVFSSMPLPRSHKLYRLLKEEKYDLLILTKPSFKYALAAFLAGVKKRIMPHNFYTSFLADAPVRTEAGQSAEKFFISLLKPLFVYLFPAERKIFVSKREEEQASEILKRAGLEAKDKFICLFPGAKRAHLNCGKEFYAKLNDKIALKHKNLKILLTAAGKEDIHTANEIFWRCIKKPAIIREVPDLDVLSAVIAYSQGVIGGCSLPAHIAAALGKKSIVFAPLKAEIFLDIPPASAIIKPKPQPCEGDCLKTCRACCLKSITLAQTYEVFDKIFTQKNSPKKGIFNEERTFSLFNN